MLLPWEGFPILKSQEIYRMPTVNSIFANIEKRNFSVIDPSDAYYLVGEGTSSCWNKKTMECFDSCNLEVFYAFEFINIHTNEET